MGNKVQTAPPIQPLPILMDCSHEREWLRQTGIQFPDPPQSDRDLIQAGTVWSGRINQTMLLLLLFIGLEIAVVVGYVTITQQTMFGAFTTDIMILLYLVYALGVIATLGWFSSEKGLICIDWILMLTISFFLCATLSIWVSQEIVIFNETFFDYPSFAEVPISTRYSQSKKVAFYTVFFIETFQITWCITFMWYYANAHTWGTPEPEVHAAYRRLFAEIYPDEMWKLKINHKMDYTYGKAISQTKNSNSSTYAYLVDPPPRHPHHVLVSPTPLNPYGVKGQPV